MIRLAALALAFLLVLPASAQDTSLRTGRSISGTLASDSVDGYAFEANAEFFVLLRVDQESVDVVVRVVGPDGEQITEVDGPALGPEWVRLESELSGTHRVEVTPFEEATGDYSITLVRLERLAADPDDLADQLMAQYDNDETPGGAIQIWRDGRTLFSRAYGMADLTQGIAFETDTRTNIGSTSKQFTAMAIMLLVEEGKVSLDEDVRTYIEELPDLGETVTVRHILTHTSGYREFINLLILSGRRFDLGDYIDRQEVIDIVQRQPSLQNSPGAEWNYNNTAFALAAVIVERVSEMDFPDFMQERVFGPLGMTGSQVRPSQEHIVPRRSVGYAAGTDGSWMEKVDIGAAMGAGGIYSTVGDLQRWVQNYAQPSVGSADIVAAMTSPYVLSTGDTTSYGLGLFIDEHRGLQRIQHGGADIAHRSMLAYYPEINAGITTQSNNAGFDGSIASRLAEAFFEDAMEPEADVEADDPVLEFDPASYDPEAFDEFVGRYELDNVPGFVLALSREESTFYLQATGQQQIEIVPTSDSTFVITVVEADITFHRNADGEVDALTLNQGGLQRATRLEEDGDGPWEPSADDLAEYAGRYFSEELETFYNLVVEEDHLVVQHRRRDDVSLNPGERDTFSGAGFSEVAFARDRNGKITSLYVANGRTRDIRFARQN